MKRIIAAVLLLAVMLSAMTCADAGIAKSTLLENAFSMLEEGNIFIERYNELTGSDVKALFETGMPYFFGGKNPRRTMSRYPGFQKRKCWEKTSWFRKDTLYLEGFDCAGYVDWARTASGMKGIDSTRNMIYKWGLYRKYWIWEGHEDKKADREMPAPERIADEALTGDMLFTHVRYNHVLMYIGTLRDYGFTETELPSLKDYLDYPLMIHCGGSPVYGDRIQKLIDEDTTGYYKGVKTTNGGVQVSVFGVPRDAADVHETVQGTDYDYFLLNCGKQVMTIVDLTGVTQWRWVRMP